MGSGYATLMVRVLYFASLRERRGIEAEEVELPEGCTVEQLFHRLFPEGGLPPVAFTRNRQVVGGDVVLEPGDEVSFLPPLGGG